MEKSKNENEINTEKCPERADDIALAGFYAKHIENPCGMEIKNGRWVHIRPFYIREAKKALEEMTNPFARELLERKIKKYENETEVS